MADPEGNEFCIERRERGYPEACRLYGGQSNKPMRQAAMPHTVRSH
ncbi:hypothetical protein HDC93_006587 [Streptomyces sp. AK010]|nr:hypothetical protein [Streptomyces sp. AK010]